MLDAPTLRAAIRSWCTQMKVVAPELNSLDAQIGDGDLGATLEKCASNIADALPGMENAGVAELFECCSAACAKASGSTFGTLLSIAFLTAARNCAGHQEIAPRYVGQMLLEVSAALSRRGGASLGDKTIVDVVHAVGAAIVKAPEHVDLMRVARDSTRHTLMSFRDKPSKTGRARMFAPKSIGVDDPGMVAFQRMLESVC